MSYEDASFYRLPITIMFGSCPHCRNVEAVIYRTSVRSVTMRCRDCGLQWTMTAHQMAKAVERSGATKHKGVAANMAAVFTEWAAAVGEQRGLARRA